ncbi:hypothetical protein VOLCADRAFT_86533 [Volvox carteri f. nagariensis]|uniref:Protein kinase domain-containing protein n=1 Tax=Volvox carteri f. nagariensis TaxID=3068 RepID=D8TIX7_VOLCA|nr:uncharacterized protein VOLCADRAFT_86533 [Volvox carteri f. nagariensis]EFJ52275.1 hypothetical protein VOLCADRAFT_86533 [Volvox carteri f. nagariensis]|eukprot:XP_002946348.1 hypothetical protein VOLCADRAFT_86533 [Volvox carteri f. nagariensis]
MSWLLCCVNPEASGEARAAQEYAKGLAKPGSPSKTTTGNSLSVRLTPSLDEEEETSKRAPFVHVSSSRVRKASQHGLRLSEDTVVSALSSTPTSLNPLAYVFPFANDDNEDFSMGTTREESDALGSNAAPQTRSKVDLADLCGSLENLVYVGERCLTEAVLTRVLSHPCVVQCFATANAQLTPEVWVAIRSRCRRHKSLLKSSSLGRSMEAAVLEQQQQEQQQQQGPPRLTSPHHHQQQQQLCPPQRLSSSQSLSRSHRWAQSVLLLQSPDRGMPTRGHLGPVTAATATAAGPESPPSNPTERNQQQPPPQQQQQAALLELNTSTAKDNSSRMLMMMSAFAAPDEEMESRSPRPPPAGGNQNKTQYGNRSQQQQPEEQQSMRQLSGVASSAAIGAPPCGYGSLEEVEGPEEGCEGDDEGEGDCGISFLQALQMLAADAATGRHCTLVVMEYMDAGTLHQAITRGDFSARRAADQRPKLLALLLTAQELAQGMAHLHGLDILHGDLKPTNVLLKGSPCQFAACTSSSSSSGPGGRGGGRTCTDPRGYTAKVADLGLARPCSGETVELSSDEWGALAYLAPEAAKGSCCKASDVYSFGVMLWEMSAGVRPYVGLTTPQVLMGLVTGTLQLTWPSDGSLYGPLRSLAIACTDYNPAERPTFEVAARILGRMVRHIRGAAEPLRQRHSSALSVEAAAAAAAAVAAAGRSHSPGGGGVSAAVKCPPDHASRSMPICVPFVGAATSAAGALKTGPAVPPLSLFGGTGNARPSPRTPLTPAAISATFLAVSQVYSGGAADMAEPPPSPPPLRRHQHPHPHADLRRLPAAASACDGVWKASSRSTPGGGGDIATRMRGLRSGPSGPASPPGITITPTAITASGTSTLTHATSSAITTAASVITPTAATAAAESIIC